MAAAGDSEGPPVNACDRHDRRSDKSRRRPNRCSVWANHHCCERVRVRVVSAGYPSHGELESVYQG